MEIQHLPAEFPAGSGELAAELPTTGGPISGRGTSSEASQGGAFATHCVDVEVDPVDDFHAYAMRRLALSLRRALSR